MPDFGRPDFVRPDSGGEPSVDAVRRTDYFIDALAGGLPVTPQDAADAELAALLGGWRDDLRWPPATGLISEADAVAALNAGRNERRSIPGRDRIVAFADTPANPRRHRRGLSVVGAAAAAVLCIGGFGAVVAGSGPGDSLYGLRTMLFGAEKQVRDDQVGLAAKTELAQVQDLIARGDWDQAQDKLVAVSDQVASIGDEVQKQQLLDQFNDLSAKVVERDPEATAPPGVVYTVPPSAAELVPAVAPSTSTSPPSDSTTPATSTATSSATPSTTATSAPAATSAPTSTPEPPSASATTEASSPAPSAPSETTAAPSSSAAPQTQNQQTTTPTTAVPSTAADSTEVPGTAADSTEVPSTAADSTTAAPGTPSAGPAAPTTTPAAPTPSAAATPPAGPAAPTPNTVVPPTAQLAPEPVESLPSAAVTTTVLVPVPAG
jgi:hypothetical protein